MALSHKQLFVVSCGLALQAGILVLINGYLPMVTHGMDMMWIAFQAWAVYFVVGCTPLNGLKAWIGYLTGILASIAIIKIMGLPGMDGLSKVAAPINLAMALAVFIVVVPAIMSENLKNMVPALFIGSGAYFASLGHAALAKAIGGFSAIVSVATPDFAPKYTFAAWRTNGPGISEKIDRFVWDDRFY